MCSLDCRGWPVGGRESRSGGVEKTLISFFLSRERDGFLIFASFYRNRRSSPPRPRIDIFQSFLLASTPHLWLPPNLWPSSDAYPLTSQSSRDRERRNPRSSSSEIARAFLLRSTISSRRPRLFSFFSTPTNPLHGPHRSLPRRRGEARPAASFWLSAGAQDASFPAVLFCG